MNSLPLSLFFLFKVTLIVNVASACGLTASNYAELVQLQNKFAGKPFEILAFPCNQFGGQVRRGSQGARSESSCVRFRAALTPDT